MNKLVSPFLETIY